MNAQKIARLEQLLERELSAEEKERLRRIKDTLEISDNDAMWDVITAMEYQRKYYEELPERISGAATEVFNTLSLAAKKEVALVQNRLAESVVEQAKKMSLKMHVQTWILWGILALLLLLLYGSLLLWAGYSIGSGQTPPLAMILRMPIGILIGALCFGSGLWAGVISAHNFSVGNKAWQQSLLTALLCFVIGGGIFSYTFF